MDAPQTAHHRSKGFDSAQQRVRDVYMNDFTEDHHAGSEHSQEHDHALANAENEGMAASGKEHFDLTVGELATQLAQKVDDQVPVEVNERSAK